MKRQTLILSIVLAILCPFICCKKHHKRPVPGNPQGQNIKSPATPVVWNEDSEGIISKDFFAVDVMFFDSYLGKVFHGKNTQKILEENIHYLKELGIGLFGLNLNWREIEPDPPEKGNPKYYWENIDGIMKILHDAEIGVKIQIFPTTEWASRKFPSKLNRAGPVKDFHMKDWKNFIQAFVERYDGDGKGDAFPGNFQTLKILNISGEVESTSNWSKYKGTSADYDRFLSQTTRWIREASPSVTVARGATNLGSSCDRITNWEMIKKNFDVAKKRDPVIKFFIRSISEEDEYDLMGFQLNYHWSGIYNLIKMTRVQLYELGYSKKIFGNHTRTTLNYTSHEKILGNPANPEYDETKALYLANQATHTIKKLTVGLAGGLRHMFIATLTDGGFSGSPGAKRLDDRALSWVFTGLLDGEAIGKSKDPSKALKPVYYSYKLFINKITGCDRKVEGLDLGEDVYAYKFTREGKDIFVLWYEDVKSESSFLNKRSVKIKLPVKTDKVLLSRSITKSSQTKPETEIIKADSGKAEISISFTPVIIEET